MRALPDRPRRVFARRWAGAAALSLAVLLPTAIAQPSVAQPSVAASSGSQQPAPKPTRLGLSYGNTLARMSQQQLEATLDDAVELNARWIRADLAWTDVQAAGPYSYSWAPFDRVVAAARERGLKVLPIITYTPSWARKADCTAFTCPPRRIADYARFARAAVERYAPLGVRTWEVWNEPNLAMFWPHPDATRYGSLLATTTRTIKDADPSARVLLGGLAAIDPSWAPGSIGARDFLAGVCATGACDLVNAVAYHPYTYPYLASDRTSFGTAWEQISRTTRSLRSVLRSSGHSRLRLWLTEYGAPTGGPGSASDGSPGSINRSTDHVTEGRQAEIARDAVELALRSPNIVALFWYTNQDNPAAKGKEAYFGLRRSDGSRKPAWFSFRDAAVAATASRTR